MSEVKLTWLDSKNIYGTMNTSSVALSNLTNADREMLMYKYDLRSSNLASWNKDDKTRLMFQLNLKPSELEEYKLTVDDKRQIFANHRRLFAEANGFDYNKMFMADQNLKKSGKRGSKFEITRDYVDANPKGWSDINEDILIVSHEVPGVVIGHPVADCPVIVMEDRKNKVVAMAHCSAELIDQKLPMMIADALNSSYGTKDEDISVIVGPCAGKDWTYDCWPRWANDKRFWESCAAIIEENGEFKIDLREAISTQLDERNIGNDRTYDMANTRTDERYYSNSQAGKYLRKYGRHFNGVVYQKVR